MTRAVLAILLAVAACGPVSPEAAQYQCLQRVRLAEQPRGSVAVGAGSGGIRSRVQVEVGSDFVTGRDPSAVYDQCVLGKSGQLPARPYRDLPR